jgi:hypothetical protein
VRFRKLRIAWSVGWSVTAVLLIALLVRSYSWDDCGNVYIPFMNWLGFRSNTGAATLYINTIQTLPWELASEPANDRLDVVPNHHGFGFLYRSPSFVDQSPALFVRIPHWLCVLFVSALAAVPWLRWRFTLRTLLIATTLVAVVLGAIVWQIRR